MNDSGLIEIIWVDDSSILGFWVDDPAWVGDPDVEEELFLTVGLSRASLKPFPVLRPLLWEVSDALGGMGIFLKEFTSEMIR